MAFCCDKMRQQIELVCDIHPDRWGCPDCLLIYSSRSKQYGLMIHDGGTSSIRIYFCPWCGAKLAESDRSERE
ncbi:MAG TPA: hypothetical protein VLM40_19065 [Gemmata sp.]|nr:hypothetical protein [Gemmata sp.]